MNLIEQISKVTGIADSKAWLAEKDNVLAQLKEAQGKITESATLKAEHDKQVTALTDSHNTELAQLKETISTLQTEVKKLQETKAEEIKIVQQKVDVAAETKAKQILLAETGIDVDRLPKLAEPAVNENKGDVLACLNSLTGPERSKYFVAHRDEILRANNNKISKE